MAVKADRYDPAALVNKGNVMMTRGDAEKASEWYAEAIQCDASCVEATYNLALAYKRMGRHADALRCFDKLNVMLRNNAQVDRLKTLNAQMQWRQRLGNFEGDGLTKRGRYPGDGSHPVGFRGEDPIGGLVDEPQADTYFGNGCKTDILRTKNRKFVHVSLFS